MNIAKKFKGVFCIILLTAVFAICGTVNVFANDLVFDMEALGITDGVENVQDRLSETVTREEFCRFVVNMMGLQSIAETSEYADVFEDISDSKYKNSIKLMYSLNLISGESKQIFAPQRDITVKEGAKILVDALGYSGTVTDKTLDGYYYVALGLGLSDRMNIQGDTLDFQNALIMIDNALDIDRMVYQNNGGYKKDDTYRNALMHTKDSNIVKMRGVVTADISTYLNTKITSLDSNQLEIEGRIYTFETEAPLGLVGQSVDFYVKTTDVDELVFRINTSEKNKVKSFDSDDITTVSQNSIRLNNERISVAQNVKYIYNNRLKRDFSLNDLDKMENFTVRAIDSDGDSKYETIFVEEYEDYLVERVYKDDFLVYLKSPSQFRGMQYIDLDTNDEDFYVQLLNKYGDEITFDDIKADMVISIAASEDGEALKVYVSDKIIEGKIAGYSNKHITIDTEEYRCRIDESKLKSGAQARVYIAFDDTAAFIEYPSDSLNYAYVYALYPKKGHSDEFQARMIIPGPVSVKYIEKEDEDGGAATKTPKLFCRNNGITVMDLADKVSVNGKRMSGEELANAILNEPIAYKLNSNNEIKTIDILKPADTTSSKYYNANELTFGKTGDTAFGISQDRTRSICLPTNTSASKNDLKELVELLNGVQYNVMGYALDDTTHIVDILLMNSEMRSGTAGITNTSSDIAMVDSVEEQVDDNDEVHIVVNMIFDKELKTYTVSDLIPNSESFMQLETGDLIAFSLDGFDNLNGYEVIQNADNYYDYILGEYTDNERFCGIVENVDYNNISNKKNRWVNVLNVMFEDGSVKSAYEVLARGSTPVFVIDSGRCVSVRAGSIDDVKPGGRVFVLSKTDLPRAVVVDNR